MKKKLLMLSVLPMLLLCSCGGKRSENGMKSANNNVVVQETEASDIEIIYNYIYINFEYKSEYYHIIRWRRYETGNDFVDLEITLAVSGKSYRWYDRNISYVLQTDYMDRYESLVE